MNFNTKRSITMEKHWQDSQRDTMRIEFNIEQNDKDPWRVTVTS